MKMKKEVSASVCLVVAVIVLPITCMAEPFELVRGLSIELPEDRRVALPVSSLQILFVRQGEQLALIEFVDVRNSAAEYRYRFYDAMSGSESEGNGKVFESYQRKKREDGSVELIDDGSQLTVVAGEIEVEWSIGYRENFYIYYDPKITEVHLLDKVFFEKSKFTSKSGGR